MNRYIVFLDTVDKKADLIGGSVEADDLGSAITAATGLFGPGLTVRPIEECNTFQFRAADTADYVRGALFRWTNAIPARRLPEGDVIARYPATGEHSTDHAEFAWIRSPLIHRLFARVRETGDWYQQRPGCGIFNRQLGYLIGLAAADGPNRAFTTADGVDVYPGMMVYHRHPDHVVKLQVGEDGEVVSSGGGLSGPVSSFYSTETAAVLPPHIKPATA